ncbi:MAG: PBP1A family penicillin-binding protein [Bacteroidetes bacterium]|nr:PBP1A family penicillin-binding protein [Bacteroidota bacterium]
MPVTSKKPNQTKKKLKFKIKYLIFSILGFVIIFNFWFIPYLFQNLPSLYELKNPKTELATKVYSSDGVLLDQFYFKNRTNISLDQIPQSTIQALISTEDKKFYTHWGVTPWRFVRALIKNIFAFRLKEGASTLTQQLARNLYGLQSPRENAFDKMTRKIREFITSVQIEREFTKDEILEMYFNTIYMGRGAYGIAAATSIFFDKNVSELTLAESSLLVGMLKGPSYYDPIRYRTRAFNRRNIVLNEMLQDDVLKIDEVNFIKQDSLEFVIRDISELTGNAPHFVELIRQQLIEKGEEYNFDIFKDGLSIYTTLDSRMQFYANKSVEEHLPIVQEGFDSSWIWSEHKEVLNNALKENIIKKINSEFSLLSNSQKDSLKKSLQKNKIFIDSIKNNLKTVQIGLVAIDPHTGEIKAMVGGADFKKFKYGLNHVTQINRQPGSSFKPFVYTVAIDNGYPPCYELLNQPVTIENVDGTRWMPENSDGRVGGKLTLREGIRESVNLIAVHAILEIAPKDQVAKYAMRMGITTKVPPYESIALGTPEVIPIDMTSAFGVFANEGVYIQPYGIKKIVDKNGNVIEEVKIQRKEVLSKETAYIMTSMLEDVVNRGTGSRIRNYFDYPAAGKTGTTQEFADAWFVGYTPQFSASVWIGFDDHRVKFTSWDGQGGHTAAPLWGKFMKSVYDDNLISKPHEFFNRPSGIASIKICLETKKKATEFCPVQYPEIYNIKYPITDCEVHISKDSQQQTPSIF